MNIQEALQIIKKSIENTAIAAVKTLRDSTYKVDVGSKPIAVEGKVAVVDWDKLQVELAKISKWQEEVGKSVRAIEVKDQVQVEISPEGFSAVLAALEELSQQVSKLPTKYPEVKIPPFPKIEFPKIPEPLKEVSVKNLEKLVGKDPKRYVPVRLSDGKRFYEAIESLTVSASRTQAFSDSQGVKQQALVDEDRHVQVDVLEMPEVSVEASSDDPTLKYQISDTDTAETTKYYGFLEADGGWYILKEDSTAGTYRYAKGTSAYADNWDNRDSLDYGLFSDVF